MLDEYTKQSELDELGFGSRWGCTCDCFFIAGEVSKGRKLTKMQRKLIIADIVTKKAPDGKPIVAFSNYKDHAIFYHPYPGYKPGWTPNANPEYHWYVRHRLLFVHIIEANIGADIVLSRFELGIMKVHIENGATGNHYVLRVDKKDVYNPDPYLVRVNGTKIQWQPLVAA
jgi:hypothetical protein